MSDTNTDNTTNTGGKPAPVETATPKTTVAPKRKAAAKTAPAKKAAAKKVPAKKAAVKKTPAKKAATKASARKGSGKQKATDFRSVAMETGRNALRAGLGVYGKAYDQVLEQIDGLQKQLDEAQSKLDQRRKQAETLYASLVTRGEALERDAIKAFNELELDAITDRKNLDAQMNKAKARFEELRSKLGKSK